MLEVCERSILTVIGTLGYLGFLTLKPKRSETSASSESLPCSTSCMIPVAVKDFEIEAILKMSLSPKAIWFSISL